ncbi:ATP-dependent helicase [Sphingomonas sp. 3-13AW]|uniref:ATP-dependent helicase n=1 Tax=Sphingomonas sp. 3-13AW TaxID=3050450 RepID=UPI003BB6BE6B
MANPQLKNEDIFDDLDLDGTVADVKKTAAIRPEVERSRVNIAACDALLADLSDDQYKAAISDAQHALLIAPAGTGKTRTIAARIAAKLRNGIPMDRILVSTYTNKAANELVERISPMLKTDVREAWVGTLHSIGLRILKADAIRKGQSPDRTIIDEVAQRQIIEQELQKHNHPMADGVDTFTLVRQIIAFINEAKNQMVPPEVAMDTYRKGALRWATGIGEAEIAIYQAYTDYLRLYDMIDYSDMLYLPTLLLEKDKEFQDTWRGKFDEIIVDEYQDVARAQVRFLNNLVGENTGFFVAADDDQSIYGWRGSEIKNVTKFKNYWPDAAVLHLAYNYRTPRPIFRVAAKLILKNADRYDKDVRTRPDEEAFVRAIECKDREDEKDRILENIMYAHEKLGIPYERMAILCRMNKGCGTIATQLGAEGIPINLHEDLPLHTRPVGALVAWMQAAVGIDNPLNFEKMVRYPEILFDDQMMNQIVQRVTGWNEKNRDQKMGPIGFLVRYREMNKLKDGSAGADLLDNLGKIRQIIHDNPSTPFAEAGRLLGIPEMVSTSKDPDDHLYGRFVSLVDSLANNAATDTGDPVAVVKSILGSLTSIDMNSGKTGVNVMTIHKAKGLEFDVVFSPEWEEGEFPSQRHGTVRDLEEERRLAYVAITRARRIMIITWAKGNRSRRPSQFLQEMGVLAE